MRKEMKYYLMLKNSRMAEAMKKLAPKLYRPFRIHARVDKSTYQLELQTRWQIHNIFYTFLLEPYQKHAIKLSQIRPEPEEREGETEYKVEQILQSEVHTSRQKVGGRYNAFKS
jgi:hypothetical protein